MMHRLALGAVGELAVLFEVLDQPQAAAHTATPAVDQRFHVYVQAMLLEKFTYVLFSSENAPFGQKRDPALACFILAILTL